MAIFESTFGNEHPALVPQSVPSMVDVIEIVVQRNRSFHLKRSIEEPLAKDFGGHFGRLDTYLARVWYLGLLVVG